LIEPCALINIDVIETDRFDLDARLAGFGFGDGNVFIGENFWAAAFVNSDRLHESLSLKPFDYGLFLWRCDFNKDGIEYPDRCRKRQTNRSGEISADYFSKFKRDEFDSEKVCVLTRPCPSLRQTQVSKPLIQGRKGWL
jgi:hypothetical protein